MGYSTDFSGQLTFSKPLSEKQIDLFQQVSGSSGESVQRERGGAAPSSYCQREVTADGTGLERDGGEKFYLYEEWLNYIETQILRKRGIIMEGEMKFQGEDVGDSGVIRRNVNGEREAIQADVVGLVCCPECGHKFLA